ncbi:uncharacterized protein LOC135680295 [Musa acuminata AAA Group]|uniref:uncharacterized protein LOC135680295 n=1 Tax=Musa acuminata AAA Group TaxID=214697 RepID=UPI0031DFB7D2
MISILSQERLIGVAFGTAFTASLLDLVPPQTGLACYGILGDMLDKLLGTMYLNSKTCIVQGQRSMTIRCYLFAGIWNKAVDGTSGPLIIYLSSRG